MFSKNDKVFYKKHGFGTVQKAGAEDPARKYLVWFKNGTLAWFAENDENLTSGKIRK